ncbi:MAG: hypothetical protein R3E84_19445 [Pseudomonadales bacterium]
MRPESGSTAKSACPEPPVMAKVRVSPASGSVALTRPTAPVASARRDRVMSLTTGGSLALVTVMARLAETLAPAVSVAMTVTS